jgi:hypothetical protein
MEIHHGKRKYSEHEIHKQPHVYHHDPEFDINIELMRRYLWFVVAISNPLRFKTRYALFRKTIEHLLHDVRANVCVIECSLGDRAPQVIDGMDARDTPKNHQINGPMPADHYDRNDPLDFTPQEITIFTNNKSMLWTKENLLNNAAHNLPTDCKYIVFLDGDITFTNPLRVVPEIIHALQIYTVVQPFQTCSDMNPDGIPMQSHVSFGYCHAQGMEWNKGNSDYMDDNKQKSSSFSVLQNCPSGNLWHPGFGLAFRAEVFNDIGGLLETAILGAGDHHMCSALIGKAHLSYPNNIHKEYKNQVLNWQKRALACTNYLFGYAPLHISHGYHGPKKNRMYIERWSILTRWYNPTEHICYNRHRVLEFSKSAPPEMIHEIILYFRQRNEDAI